MRVGRVTKAPGRLLVMVRFAPGEPDRTWPALADRVLGLLPGLAEHRCANDHGRPFSDEAAATEVAHLFEHVVLELLALSGSTRPTGDTVWDFGRDGRGVYEVSFACDDERVGRAAIRLGATLMHHALTGSPAPDLERGVTRLRAMRSH